MNIYFHITFDKSLDIDDKYGLFDFSSNLRVRNYEVNKQSNLFVNDINWQSKRLKIILELIVNLSPA